MSDNNTLDIIDRLTLKPPHHNLTSDDLAEAAQEIRDLRETVNELTAWNQGVEADNDTLRKEIVRLHGELEEARNEADDLSRETWDHGGALGQFERENDDA
jgi:predicted RNase H-like nuclease (RuvC/YqgF family)